MIKHFVENQASDTRSHLNETRIIVDRLSSLIWQPSDGFLGLVYRAVARQQHDALAAIVDLVTHEQGHVVVTFLRPACEELIWLKYLRSIDPIKAETLVILYANLEARENLQAQHDFVGKAEMHKLGFSDQFLEDAETSPRRR